VPLVVRDRPDRLFGLVEANFTEKGAWYRLSTLVATPMAIASSLYNLPEKDSLRQRFTH
jgi:hypothetical protein